MCPHLLLLPTWLDIEGRTWLISQPVQELLKTSSGHHSKKYFSTVCFATDESFYTLDSFLGPRSGFQPSHDPV